MKDYSEYLKLFDRNCYITISYMSLRTHIAYSDCAGILDEMAGAGYLKKDTAIRCPECGLFLKVVPFGKDVTVTDELYCANCDETISITDDCLDVVYEKE